MAFGRHNLVIHAGDTGLALFDQPEVQIWTVFTMGWYFRFIHFKLLKPPQ